jgi:hypothetical protein
MQLISRILFAAGILLIFAQPTFAQSKDFEMLPPTFFGTSTPCTQGTGGQDQVLVFGGSNTNDQSAINCLNGGFTVNPTNNFVGIGTASPQVQLDVNGAIRPGTGTGLVDANCSPAGAMEYDSTTNAMVFCSSKSGTWQNMGGSNRTWHTAFTNVGDTGCVQNTSSNEMQIIVNLNTGGNGAYVDAWTGPTDCTMLLAESDEGRAGGGYDQVMSMTADIPPGWFYRAAADGSGVISVNELY